MGSTTRNLRTKKAYDVAPFQRLAGSISSKSRNFNLAVYPKAGKKKPFHNVKSIRQEELPLSQVDGQLFDILISSTDWTRLTQGEQSALLSLLISMLNSNPLIEISRILVDQISGDSVSQSS